MGSPGIEARNASRLPGEKVSSCCCCCCLIRSEPNVMSCKRSASASSSLTLVARSILFAGISRLPVGDPAPKPRPVLVCELVSLVAVRDRAGIKVVVSSLEFPRKLDDWRPLDEGDDELGVVVVEVGVPLVESSASSLLTEPILVGCSTPSATPLKVEVEAAALPAGALCVC